MKCINCGDIIPEGRLKALPGIKSCINCSETERVAGFPIITGKTTYSELEILKQEKAKELYEMQERKGKGIVKPNKP
jgi:hypothetical protein